MSRHTTIATWDDAPHLTKEVKEELWASIPENERQARTKGIPSFGGGAIYPFPEEDFVITDFPLPGYYVQGYGLDVGWRRTAAVFGAWDKDGTDNLYIFGEYYRGECEMSVHAAGIRAKGKGDWLPGVCDPAAEQASQIDGRRCIDELRKAGLQNLSLAEPKLVASGITLVHDRFSTGRLKIFRSCTNLLEELRLYRRAERTVHGVQTQVIVKENDHLMDALRYLVTDGMRRMRLRPAPERESKLPAAYSGDRGWMA